MSACQPCSSCLGECIPVEARVGSASALLLRSSSGGETRSTEVLDESSESMLEVTGVDSQADAADTALFLSPFRSLLCAVSVGSLVRTPGEVSGDECSVQN